jgi:Holliday junction resolvase-like predicted endonuclease
VPSDPAALRRLIGEYRQLRGLEGHTPQSRGQRFNGLIAEVLRCQGIDAQENVRAAGEIDVIFTVDGAHYLLEAKWQSGKVDTGFVAKLQKRVRQRLAGTLGVLLSMSGYSPEALADVKDGERLEVMLLDQSHWEAMLSGQVTPAKLLGMVRSHAAFRGEAHASLPDLLGSSLPVPRLNFAAPVPAAGLLADELPGELQDLISTLQDGLGLGEHDKAARRVYGEFVALSRNDQETVVDGIAHIATTTRNHEREIVACSLLEAADRLDPTLIKIELVEAMATSGDFTLRSSAAVLLWQWAQANPGRVPLPLLGRLTLPSAEDWYVHAAARAGAKQLMLRRADARIIFELMASSKDPSDRQYAASDLLEVARIEPRAIPADLANSLANDSDGAVASSATELLHVIANVNDQERIRYFNSFGM